MILKEEAAKIIFDFFSGHEKTRPLCQLDGFLPEIVPERMELQIKHGRKDARK
jgi:hypothetical protein